MGASSFSSIGQQERRHIPPKSLVGNLKRMQAILVLKTDEGTSQVEEGLRLCASSFSKPHQEALRAIDPRVQALHYPLPGSLDGLQIAAGLRFRLVMPHFGETGKHE